MCVCYWQRVGQYVSVCSVSVQSSQEGQVQHAVLTPGRYDPAIHDHGGDLLTPCFVDSGLAFLYGALYN